MTALSRRLSNFPRVELAEYPTPLEPLPRLSRELGRRILVKRDDMLGPALGGNKTRKLEYLIAEALEVGAKRIATFGGLQSNHVRLTAGVAKRFGFEPHLFYFERRPSKLEGNLLLNSLLEAKMHFIPFPTGGEAIMKLETANRLVRWLARLTIGPHYFVPVGGHSWRGCLGYVRAALEIQRQVEDLEIDRAWLITAVGTGGTLAGLWAGLTVVDSELRLLGIDVGRLWKGFGASISEMAVDLLVRLGIERSLESQEVPLIEGDYVGSRYAVPTEACVAAIRHLARLEGLLLDPIYTGKAFAGMLDLLAKGKLGEDDPVIFLHTGGLPGLFPFARQLLAD